MTRFLADECVWLSLIEELRRRGHSVRAVREFASGTLDEQVLEIAYAAGEVLFTEDSDFGPLVFKEGRACAGMVLIPFARFRAAGASATETIVDRVEAIMDRLPGAVTVIEPERTRQRKLHGIAIRTPSGDGLD